jgi:NAD(P)-dependent dehydrogenase (short-subunit alcohol dehydrogenase family)
MANASSSQRMVGKVALVTGAASGIGKAIAQSLAQAGARVALADVNEAALTAVTEAIRADTGHVIAVRLDVTSETDWQSAMTRIVAEWSRLDILINCAGTAFACPITETALTDWRRVMTTNLDSVFLSTRQAMTAMKESGGCIINIASAAGIKAIAGNAIYGTSKAAIRFFTRVAALEGAPQHIRVNSISPGAVATPMWESTDLWPKQVAETSGQDAALRTLVQDRGFAEPKEIAAAVLFLASDDARHATGVDLPLDAGFAIVSLAVRMLNRNW